MDIETFEDIINSQIPDDQTESAFNLLIVKSTSFVETTISALNLLEKYHPELGGKIAVRILSCAPSEQIEEAFDLFAQKNSEKEMAKRVITLWDINPEVAEKIDKKYSLGVKESMDEDP